MHEDPTQLIDI